MIHARGLVQTFHAKKGREKTEVRAVDGVDLDVAEGSIFALLDPNGAGKTTIVQILSTLIEADAGALRIAGAAPPSCSNASTSSRRLAGRPRRTPAACDPGSTSR